MPRHRFSLPLGAWPDDVRDRFAQAFHSATKHQRPRLEQGLGRWLKAAEEENLPAELITPALLDARTATMSPELAVAMKQALQAVFPNAHPFVSLTQVDRESPREALRREIARNWHRLPADWANAAGPLLYMAPDGLNDGVLVQARSVSGLQSLLQSAWAFHDFCRENGLPQDVTPLTLSARLDTRQQAFRTGELSISTALAEVQRLKFFGQALFPQRDWNWMSPVIKELKRRARMQPTRNNGRVVDLLELKAAADQAATMALEVRMEATDHKSRTAAHKMARTALALSLLINSPIRLDCLARLDLERHLDPELCRLRLSAHETKDGKSDLRAISPTLRTQLLAYLKHHRPGFAPPGETALFVGSRGKPIGPDYLSQCIGALTFKLFGKQVTAQVVRNMIAGFIVSEAPQEAALASEVLNHSNPSTTETYRKAASQIEASRRLGNAANAAGAGVGLNEPVFGGRSARSARAKGRLQRKK